MLTFGIQRAADGEYLRREINQRHLEFRFEIKRVVAAARSEFEHCARCRLARVVQHARKERRLLRVIRGRGKERPPLREFVVQLHRGATYFFGAGGAGTSFMRAVVSASYSRCSARTIMPCIRQSPIT